MKDTSYLLELAQRVLKEASGDQAFVIVSKTRRGLTRFANNTIHQNLSQEYGSIDLLLVRNGVPGRASANQGDEGSVKKLLNNAEAACANGAPITDFPEALRAQTYKNIDAFDEAIIAADQAWRAGRVGIGFDVCKVANLEAAGMLTTEVNEIAVAGSGGVQATHAETNAAYSITASGGNVSGWAQQQVNRLDDINIKVAAEKAVGDCQRAVAPEAIEPGDYTVVLPPEAAGDFLYFMAYITFNGLAFNEGRSAFSGKLGQKLFADCFTVRDDAHHPLVPGMPFDFEGYPRRSLTLIDKGVAKAVVHDRRTARAAGTDSTGHALPQPSTLGAVPLNLVVEPGDSSLEELIAATERGLYVTHFHYTNVIDPMRLVLTGMTRDGVWRIEDGKLTTPVNNMRFTESAFRAYGGISGLTKEQKAVKSGFGGAMILPGMKIDAFAFTSATEF